jgi:hypothetical protein
MSCWGWAQGFATLLPTNQVLGVDRSFCQLSSLAFPERQAKKMTQFLNKVRGTAFKVVYQVIIIEESSKSIAPIVSTSTWSFTLLNRRVFHQLTRLASRKPLSSG